MRFHHLTLSAFGPFPGTESVDFDDLNAGGLFLLTGPTGAGKTSVLDAICFALYGSVPGVRGVKTLKSHHAGAEARPEVTLDFSLRGRRFVVRRSPEWSRPKRRGSGVTIEKASATLIETTGGVEHFLSSRAQEVGLLVSGLIGMRASQFVQVAMLPQGEFARFLRADSQDRHEVLQQLFKTDRFARIEDWVLEHSRRLRERAGAQRSHVQRALDAVADRAGVPLPDHLSGPSLDRVGSDDIRSWASARLDSSRAALAAAETGHADASATLQQARARHDQAGRTADAMRRREQALAVRDSVPDEAEAEDARAALHADTRASRCLPVLRLLDEAEETAARAALRWESARARLAGLDVPAAAPDGDLDEAALASIAAALRELVARTRALLPREQALVAARERRAADAGRLEELLPQIAECGHQLTSLPTELAELRAELADLTSSAAAGPALELELERGRAAVAAATELPGCAADLVRRQDRRRDLRDRAADARDRMQELVARRLAGMAAELAGRLEQDAACPVCGSADHPAPAQPGSDPVTEAEQTAATEDYHRLTSAHTEAVGKTIELERRLEELRQAADGHDAHQAAAVVAELEQRRDAAARAGARLAETRQHLDDRETRLRQLTERAHELDTARAALERALDEQQRVIDDGERELATALDASPGSFEGLAGQLESLRSTLELVESAAEQLAAHGQARDRVRELAVRTQQAAAEEGFGSSIDVQRAMLPADERRRVEEMLESRAEALAKADGTLSEPEVVAVADVEAPDLEATRAALAAADATCAEAARLLHQQQDATAAIGAHLTRLQDALDAWAPARAEHERTESMARLVRGNGSDNVLQMRLSAYVLATRLDQVLDAANERLSQMRDQRYLLERTGKASRRNAQAGLGLQVLDAWTGEVRDPATLSGGESFVVSLSLALGLADVVTQEAGGTEIDTLFVDEGFGTLDADTLDDVMDRLDGLRAGGRTVGVVSHVHELRTRIPTQLHVEKRRNGSSLAVRTLTG